MRPLSRRQLKHPLGHCSLNFDWSEVGCHFNSAVLCAVSGYQPALSRSRSWFVSWGFTRVLSQYCKFPPQNFKLFLGQAFQINHAVFCAPDGPDNFVKFDLKSKAVAVLAVLNDEHHEEGANGRARVNDHLPFGRVLKSSPHTAQAITKSEAKANTDALPAHFEITAEKTAKDFSILSTPIFWLLPKLTPPRKMTMVNAFITMFATSGACPPRCRGADQ